MKTVIAWSAAALLVSAVGVYGQNAVPASTDEAWRNDMAAFAAAVADVAANSQVPDDFQLSQSMRSRSVLSGQDGTPTWVVLKDGFEKELHGELAKAFAGQVSWQGKVTTAELNQEKKTCNIRVEFPKASGMPANCELTDAFIVIPFDKLPAEKLPAVGTLFSFTGNLKKAKDDDLLDRVWVLYGRGTNAGKNRIGVSLTDEAPAVK